MKTQEEIVNRVRYLSTSDYDLLGFEQSDLLEYLDFEHARPFLKKDATPEAWAKIAEMRKPPIENVKGYLDFAWDKANKCRGLSAGRSLNHLSAWLWLAGYDELVQSWREYNCYGKMQLVLASELVGFDWRAHDNGVWRNGENEKDIVSEKTKQEQINAALGIARQYRQ